MLNAVRSFFCRPEEGLNFPFLLFRAVWFFGKPIIVLLKINIMIHCVLFGLSFFYVGSADYQQHRLFVFYINRPV
jgi:hypothetical protein